MIRMTTLSALTALTLGAIASPALADNVRVQSGVLCDTAEQAARLSELVRQGNLRDAIVKVNLEASKPTACGVAAVAYTDSEQVGEIRAENGVQLFRIIRVTVVGVKGPDGIKRVAAVEQFALAPARSFEA